MTFPVEIWTRIAEFCTLKDLKSLIRTNKLLFHNCIQKMYKNPHFHPLANQLEWTDFMDRILYKNGFIEYQKYIQEIEDVWLFVGGEDTLVRQDSKLDEKEIPRYSLYHYMQVLMLENRIKKISLSFYSELIEELPWNSVVHLTSLDLGIRVTDSIAIVIFSNLNSLETLHLRRAEISDKTIHLLPIHLQKLSIFIIPIEKRSRYQKMMDPSLELEITEQSLSTYFQKSTRLNRIHIQCIYTSLDPFGLLKGVKSLSLTLSSQHETSLLNMIEMLKQFNGLESISIYASKKPFAPLQDTVLKEDQVMQLALELPVKKVTLVGVDLCRNDGSSVYYSPFQCSWEYDRFKTLFCSQFANVELEYLQE
jgi:hypothetical protein